MPRFVLLAPVRQMVQVLCREQSLLYLISIKLVAFCKKLKLVAEDTAEATSGAKAVSAYRKLRQDATNLNTEVLRTTIFKPDLVFMSVVGQLNIYAKELRRLKFKGSKIAMYIDEPRLKNSDGALEGTISSELVQLSDRFINKFKAHFNATEVLPPAGIAYDAVMLLAKAIRSANSDDVSKVKHELLKQKNNGA